MQTLYIFTLLIIAAVYGYVSKINIDKKRRKKQQYEEQLRPYQQFLEENSNTIETLKTKIDNLSSNKYHSYTEFQVIVKQISNLHSYRIPNIEINNNKLHNANLQLLSFAANSEKIRAEKNMRFIAEEKQSQTEYFASILNNPLDEQQIDAILHDEDNCLIIAGAGCGKTTTVQGKVNYLLDNKLAAPGEILLLSFSKDSATDLEKKLGSKNVECMTFHSLAHKIISKTIQPPDIFDPKEFESLIKSIHSRLLNNPKYLKTYNDFIINGIRITRDENEFDDLEELVQYNKDAEFNSIKAMMARKETNNGSSLKSKLRLSTINNEYVKSGQECYIANFLFLNRINYSYESVYFPQDLERETLVEFDLSKKKYRPDFTIYLNGYDESSIKHCDNPEDNVIFLEHYGIDKDGNTPKFFQSPNKDISARDYYIELMEWKDKVHEAFGTRLIKTYSHQFQDKTIDNHLKKILKEMGVVLNPMTETEVLEILDTAYSKEIEATMGLIMTFINLVKSNKKSFPEIYKQNQDSPNQAVRDRNKSILAIIDVIYQEYQKHLRSKQLLDFNDLINFATDLIETNKFQSKYRYIIVDEFQDISINRANFLKLLKDQSTARLFAVGDDWQSIYRFAGSDLTLFNQFQNNFGYSIIRKIETTYRFANPLIEISGKFILKNPNQTPKNLRSRKTNETTVKLLDSKINDKINIEDVKRILNEVFKDVGTDLNTKSILLLGRYNLDFKDLEQHVKNRKIRVKSLLKRTITDAQGNEANEQLNFDNELQLLTVHKSKGLESDIVILINCESGRFGFPAELSDDLILDLILSADDTFKNGEERRAMYVAMTRAKERFYFYGPKNKLSKFVREMFPNEFTNPDAEICHRCGGIMKFLKTYTNSFGTSQLYICTNKSFGCATTRFINQKPNKGKR